MIDLRRVETDDDYDAWAALKSRVASDDPVTAEHLIATEEPDRLLLLAERDGVLAGCGVANRSSFGAKAYIMARVLPEHRRRGVGTALVRALGDHARRLGRPGVNGFVGAADTDSVAFVEGLGLAEVWDMAQQGYADMPLPGKVTDLLETWLRDEATRPDGSFVALAGGAPVGYAGLKEHANGPATAEHGLTVVHRRDHRRRGIAHALKLTQLHWASDHGVVELVTSTQKGNEAVQALNASLGYENRSRVLTMQEPLP